MKRDGGGKDERGVEIDREITENLCWDCLQIQGNHPAAGNFRRIVIAVIIEVADHQQLVMSGRQVQAVKGIILGKVAHIDHPLLRADRVAGKGLIVMLSEQ